MRKNRKIKQKSGNVKEKRAEMITTREAFTSKCNLNQERKNEKEAYLLAQKELKEAIEAEEKKQTQERMDKILEKGKINPNVIWEIKKATWTDPDLEYDIRKEDGTVITDPEEARQHCAEYFEDLYQARPGTTEYEEWTKHITEKVQTIAKNHSLTGIQEKPITMEELKKSIKRLKRNKSVGPDQIPNEMFIEATEETKEIFLEIMNQIDRTEEIPSGWQQGEIKRIYKGKGSKGKCSNEREISLASNF